MRFWANPSNQISPIAIYISVTIQILHIII